MRATRLADADAFLERAGSFLLAREAEHNLILGLSGRLRATPRFYGEDPYFAVVESDGRVVAAALRTPPHNLLLSEVDDLAALGPLAADAGDAFGRLPGVLGPKPAAAEFARLWQDATGSRGQVVLAERIYRASEAFPPDGVPGRLRRYEDADHRLLVDWIGAFAEEAMPDGAPERPQEVVDRRLADADGGFVLWDDGGAVSLAGYGSPTPSGIRIGPVYTPPGLRGRGYASAVTAAVTHDLLAGGRRFCFLYTDLVNPTSNSIYQRVGYRAVADVDQWRFD